MRQWHVQCAERSKWLGELVLLLAPWVMPLFMLLAGASAWYSLGKRSASAYLHERVTRVIVPLGAGVLLLVPPQMYIDRRQRGLFDGSLLEFYPRFFEGVSPNGNFGWLHRWFLGILALLTPITLPLFRWLRGTQGRRALSWVARICAPPGALLVLAQPMIAVRSTLWGVFPNSRPIVADWSNRTVLLPLFIYGYMVAGEPGLARAVDRQWKLVLAVAVGFSAAMFAWAWPGNFVERFPIPFSADYVLFWSASALGAWAWCVGLFGAARAIRRADSRVLDRAPAGEPLLHAAPAGRRGAGILPGARTGRADRDVPCAACRLLPGDGRALCAGAAVARDESPLRNSGPRGRPGAVPGLSGSRRTGTAMSFVVTSPRSASSFTMWK